MPTSVYVRPIAQWMNPSQRPPSGQDPDQHAESRDLVAYVLFKQNEMRTRPTRVATSVGPLTSTDTHLKVALNAILRVYNTDDATLLGKYVVVGIHHFGTGSMVGEVPDRAIKRCLIV